MSEIITNNNDIQLQLNSSISSGKIFAYADTSTLGGSIMLQDSAKKISIIDCKDNKLRLYYHNQTTLNLTYNRLDINAPLYIEAADAQYQMRSTNYPNSYANLFIGSDGGSLELSNSAGTAKTLIDMHNGDAVWHRWWTTATSYRREIRITDDHIELTGPLTINGTITGNNVSRQSTIKTFYSTTVIVPQSTPSGAKAGCIGSAEVDLNAMVVRVKMCLWDATSGGASWSSSAGYIFTPTMILSACGLTGTYNFDASRLTNGAATGVSGVTGYRIGNVVWNYTKGTNIGAHQTRGAYVLYRTNGYCTIQRTGNADGASDLNSWWIPINEIFYDRGIVIDMTLPISAV